MSLLDVSMPEMLEETITMVMLVPQELVLVRTAEHVVDVPDPQGVKILDAKVVPQDRFFS